MRTVTIVHNIIQDTLTTIISFTRVKRLVQNWTLMSQYIFLVRKQDKRAVLSSVSHFSSFYIYSVFGMQNNKSGLLLTYSAPYFSSVIQDIT